MDGTSLPQTGDVREQLAERTAEVEAIYASLTAEHARLLDAIEAARGLLGTERGRLAEVVPLHDRLPPRHLEVARVADEEPGHAALVQAVEPRRHEVAELDVAVHRRRSTLETLADIERSYDLDGSLEEGRLPPLVAARWRTAYQDGHAAVDDAYERATMRFHVARLENGDVVEASANLHAARFVRRSGEATALPPMMAAALDTADHTGLDSLLTSLIDYLDTPGTPNAWRAREADTDEAFNRFWRAELAPPPERSAFRSLAVQVLLPMVATLAALALVLALVG